MKTKRAFIGAGIILCALLICIGVILVATNPMTDNSPSSKTTAIEQNNTVAKNSSSEDDVSSAKNGPGSESEQPTAEDDTSPSDDSANAPSQNTSPDSGESTTSGVEFSGQNAQNTTQSRVQTCTISIDCSAALQNRDQLSAGILQNLPANGMILAPSVIEVSEGDTAFSILQNACSKAGIAIDYTGGFFGSSVYVRSIGPLGEFDCGSQSGWTYLLNGQTLPKSASECVVHLGDVITWSYTCGL